MPAEMTWTIVKGQPHNLGNFRILLSMYQRIEHFLYNPYPNDCPCLSLESVRVQDWQVRFALATCQPFRAARTKTGWVTTLELKIEYCKFVGFDGAVFNHILQYPRVS